MAEFKEETKETSSLLHGDNIVPCRAIVTVTAVAREQLCGHAVMEETFSMQSLPGLYNDDQ
jgi:hypothetical protein